MRKSVHYYGLDVLRLLAATLVLSDHFGAFGWAHPVWHAASDARAFPWFACMENVGSIGVEIFFLISGFVISASAKGATASQFATSRAIRVLPTLWICGLIAFSARAFSGEPIVALVEAYLRSAALLPTGPYIDGVVWTLVVEALFYALIFLLLLGNAFSRIETLAKTLGTLSAGFITALSIATLLASTHHLFAAAVAIGERFPFKILLLRHGVFFAAGMLLWAGFDRGFTRTRLGWLAALCVACSVEIVLDRGTAAEAAIALAVWWAGLALIVISVAGGERIAARVGAWKRPIQDAGRLSYPLYLNHYALGTVLVPALCAGNLPHAAVFAATFAIVVGSSYLVMRYPERFAQRLLRNRLLGRTAKPQGDLQTSPALG